MDHTYPLFKIIPYFTDPHDWNFSANSKIRTENVESQRKMDLNAIYIAEELDKLNSDFVPCHVEMNAVTSLF